MKIFTIILVCLIFSSTIVTAQEKTTVEFYASKEEKKKNLPFSDAVRVGDLLILSGQIGMDHSIRKLVPGGIEAETKQALNNIKEVLEHHGSSMDHVVKCIVILADIKDFQTMNKVYTSFFSKPFPARTTFSADLVANAQIEIECTAVLAKK